MTGFSLPLPGESQTAHGSPRLTGAAYILGPPWSHLPVITIGLLGYQIFWSVEMSYASPYLLSLGLNKALMAMVFVAGPLSGLIVQPVIGILADNSTSRFGRRRPYMIGGALLCVFAMFLLGFTRYFASVFTTYGSSANDRLTIWLAVLAIYCIDFSVNIVMAVDRALLVDTLPTSKQASANAWGARMLGIGSVLGFFFGGLDLVRMFPFFGTTELEVLAVLSSFCLLSTHFITAFSVKERVLISSNSEKSFRREFADIFVNIRTLPRAIRQIFAIQFFAWLGWFPVLFYTTTYVGELHKRASPVPQDEASAISLDAEATRYGSRALLYFSILSLLANVGLPLFVGGAERQSIASLSLPKKRTWREIWQVDLGGLWAASHAVFAACMFGTLFTSSVTGATILMTLTGFPWAVTQWAPFSLLAEAILSESESPEDPRSIHLSDRRTFADMNAHPQSGEVEERQHFLVGDDGDDEDGESHDNLSVSRSSMDDGPEVEPLRQYAMQNAAARRSRLNVDQLHADDADDEDRQTNTGLSAKAGIILGIHNLFIVVPQFLITALSSIVFAIFEPEKSVLHGSHPGNIKPGNKTIPALPIPSNETSSYAYSEPKGVNSVALIFRIGGVATAVSFILCWRMARELRRR